MICALQKINNLLTKLEISPFEMVIGPYETQVAVAVNTVWSDSEYLTSLFDFHEVREYKWHEKIKKIIIVELQKL